VLFFMVINAAVGDSSGRRTGQLRSEVDRLDKQVLDGIKNLVELKNSVREVERETAVTRGLSRRILEQIAQLQQELANYEQTSLAAREHVNRLKTEIRTLEQQAKRLSAAAPSDDTPGDRLRAFVGDGDRQYLTGLKVGGERILVLVDASASMLDDTIVNIIRRRNLPDHVKINADKWQQAVRTVDWITAQFPRQCLFQIYLFDESAHPLLAGTAGRWLDGGDREVLEKAILALKKTVPGGGTSLYHPFVAAAALDPPPDNLLLVTDGLPTRGKDRPRSRTVSPKQRLRLFERALGELPRGVPVNVILFPIEGDPLAASAYWKLALATGGSYMNPAGDWP
jgi:hypothetical protein